MRANNIHVNNPLLLCLDCFSESMKRERGAPNWLAFVMGREQLTCALVHRERLICRSVAEFNHQWPMNAH